MKKAPAHLDNQARAKWRELSKVVNVGQPGTADALAAYAVAFSRWVFAERKVQELGLIVKSATGVAQENPYLGIVKKSMAEMSRWGKALGIVANAPETGFCNFWKRCNAKINARLFIPGPGPITVDDHPHLPVLEKNIGDFVVGLIRDDLVFIAKVFDELQSVNCSLIIQRWFSAVIHDPSAETCHEWNEEEGLSIIPR